jgi:hypothetical protein
MTKGQISWILPPEIERVPPPDNSADLLRLPTLDERAILYLRAVHGERDFTNGEHATARGRILDEIASHIAWAVHDERDSADQEDSAARDRIDEIADRLASELGEHSRAPDSLKMREYIDPTGSDEYLRPSRFASAPILSEFAARAPATRRASLPQEALNAAAPLDAMAALPANLDIARDSSRKRQKVKLRRRHIAKQFGGLAIGAAAGVLLLAGAYRLDWIPRNNTNSESHFAASTPSVVAARIGSAETGLPHKQGSTSQTTPSPAVVATTRLPSPAPVLSNDFVPSPQGMAPPQPGDPGTPVVAKAGTASNVDDIAGAVRRGEALIVNGEILAARLVLKEAADANSAEAALALGMTYDPFVLKELELRRRGPEPRVALKLPSKVDDVLADVDLARHWYQKSKDLGSTKAQARLDALAIGKTPLGR